MRAASSSLASRPSRINIPATNIDDFSDVCRRGAMATGTPASSNSRANDHGSLRASICSIVGLEIVPGALAVRTTPTTTPFQSLNTSSNTSRPSPQSVKMTLTPNSLARLTAPRISGAVEAAIRIGFPVFMIPATASRISSSSVSPAAAALKICRSVAMEAASVATCGRVAVSGRSSETGPTAGS